MPTVRTPNGSTLSSPRTHRDFFVCFFKAAAKFDGRYAAFAIRGMRPLSTTTRSVVFAIVDWTPTFEKKVAGLVQAAVA